MPTDFSQPTVTASCWSDDRQVVVESFPVNAVLAEWDDAALRDLLEADFAFDYSTDRLVYEAADYDPRVEHMVRYMEYKREEGVNMGFGCYVRDEEVLAWLQRYRSHLLAPQSS